jgi:heme/copper-type cytochrome/quinol oxidase subunit 4
MKEKLLLAAFLIMLTGVPYTVTYYGVLSRAQPIVNCGVALIFFAGFLGLYNMYWSARLKDQQRRNAVFIVGLLLVLIAFVALEGLMWEFGQG